MKNDVKKGWKDTTISIWDWLIGFRIKDGIDPSKEKSNSATLRGCGRGYPLPLLEAGAGIKIVSNEAGLGRLNLRRPPSVRVPYGVDGFTLPYGNIKGVNHATLLPLSTSCPDKRT